MGKKAKWSYAAVAKLFDLPFLELLFKAHAIHRKNFSTNHIQLSTLLSIKTGNCPEDCAYCPQSGHYSTGVKQQKLLQLDEVISKAKKQQQQGATRFCMGAAWRSPPQKDFYNVVEMIKEVKKLGMETCVTLGMLDEQQTQVLKNAGLDFYNHNLDTSPQYYQKIITTRAYQERLDTLDLLQKSGIKTCCGGIVGMGESREDRINLLLQLANLVSPPESVPINRLINIPGTPLENINNIDNFEFIRVIAIARILMPHSVVRLSAGRENMSDEVQALCFFAGANSIFLGDCLLVTPNPKEDRDFSLLRKLGLERMS